MILNRLVCRAAPIRCQLQSSLVQMGSLGHAAAGSTFRQVRGCNLRNCGTCAGAAEASSHARHRGLQGFAGSSRRQQVARAQHDSRDEDTPSEDGTVAKVGSSIAAQDAHPHADTPNAAGVCLLVEN